MTLTEAEILEQLPAVPRLEVRVESWLTADELLAQLPAIARLERARA
ncbi:MAG: hypothetical protein JWM80_4060 [Cyanobacteria bacterium RYN_339]|nr:hypothetical protein [Cyanobacteria bacterium RYN_339]